MTVIPRSEHPRPDRFRPDWHCLNGVWEFDFDDGDVGLRQEWSRGERSLSQRIVVPFPYQAPLSGIHTPDLHPVLWYRRRFDFPEALRGRRVLLHFGAVDYEARVWLNGVELGEHAGGHTPFCFDVTRRLRLEGNVLVVRVVDTESMEQPRGKQFWERDPALIFYTRTSGIWQPVWLEAVGRTWIDAFRITPRATGQEVTVRVDVRGESAQWRLRVEARSAGQTVSAQSLDVEQPSASLRLSDARLWSPEDPFLYGADLVLESRTGAEIDRVRSYFGLRDVRVEGNRILLNERPLYQKLVLDQGYWPEGLLAAPSDEAMRRDVELAQRFGFNGVRKHQKIEDPRWLYWADRRGLLVWGEMPSPGPIANAGPDLQRRFEPEWIEAIERDANHPSVITWVPFNEAWGIWSVQRDVEVQRFVERIVQVTKALDPSRPVCDVSGWKHVQTDIADVHQYESSAAALRRWWDELRERDYESEPGLRSIAWEGDMTFFVPGRRYEGQPVLISEYGGIGFVPPGRERPRNAFAQSSVGDAEALAERFRSLTEAVRDMDGVCGYCWTQLTDVEQEINGLATYDREPKVDPERIAAVNRQSHPGHRRPSQA